MPGKWDGSVVSNQFTAAGEGWEQAEGAPRLSQASVGVFLGSVTAPEVPCWGGCSSPAVVMPEPHMSGYAPAL